MDVSELMYEKAKLTLDFVKENPECSIQSIAINAGMHASTIQQVVNKMIKGGCLTYVAKKHTGGRKYYYLATGNPLPQRQVVKTERERGFDKPVLMIDPVPTESFIKLPSFLRAITPFEGDHSAPAVQYIGHTTEQHVKQSRVMRQQRKKVGVVYTGESRI